MPGGLGYLVVGTWPHPRYGWIIIPLEVSGDIILDMVLSTYSPLSYVSEGMAETLRGLGFAEPGDQALRLKAVSIQGQSLPDLEVRTRRFVAPDTHGAFGLDFLNRFIEIRFHVAPTHAA